MDFPREITIRSLKKLRKFRLAKDLVGERNLELGCSAPGLSKMLKKGLWVGVDFDLPVVREYNRYVGSTGVVAREKLPFLSESFDTVLMLDFLEHVDQDQLLLQEAARVLRERGRLILSVPRSGKLLINLVKKILGLKKEVYGHKREGYTEEELLSMLSKAGFEIETMQRHTGFFLELLEAFQNFLYFRMKGKKERRAGSISPVGEEEIRGLKKFLFLKKLTYPIFLAADLVDRFLPTSSHVIFVSARLL